MEEGTKPDLSELNLEKEEYKMPEAAPAPLGEHTHHAPIRILLLLFLLFIVAGISAYIYYGMVHTPTIVTTIDPVQQEEPMPIVDETTEGPSPEVIARMEAMQRESTLSDEDVAKLQTMQSGEQAEVDQATLDRMQAMNPGVALPNP